MSESKVIDCALWVYHLVMVNGWLAVSEVELVIVNTPKITLVLIPIERFRNESSPKRCSTVQVSSGGSIPSSPSMKSPT